jgi:hypothetical protein
MAFPFFYVSCCDELCYPLAQLFTFCFENSILPEIWLKSFISPMLKKGCSGDANNYCPIFLIATLWKLKHGTGRYRPTYSVSS